MANAHIVKVHCTCPLRQSHPSYYSWVSFSVPHINNFETNVFDSGKVGRGLEGIHIRKRYHVSLGDMLLKKFGTKYSKYPFPLRAEPVLSIVYCAG